MAEQQAKSKTTSSKDNRRSVRVILVVPVQMAWAGADGAQMKELVETESVNRHGAVLRVKTHPPASTQIDLTQVHTGESRKARVVRLRGKGEDGRSRIAVELAVPSVSFWGVPFQLQEISALLRHVDEALQSSDVDARVVRDFSQAGEHLRRAAWAAQQWVELQAKGRDPYAVLSQLSAERIRRIGQLAGELSNDLDATEVTFETEGLEGLFQSVQGLFNRLSRLFRK